MTDNTATAADLPQPPSVQLASHFLLRAGLVIGAVVLGDFLFFDRPIGISLALFIAALAGALLITARPPVRTALIGAAGLILALLPLIESVGLLSVSIAIVALALFAAFIAAGEARCEELVRSAVALLAVGPFQYAPDLMRARRAGRFGVRRSDLKSWLLPLGLGLAFLLLFGAANPLIGDWLESFAPWHWFDHIDFVRVILWLLLLMIAWPVILPRVRSRWRVFDPPASVQEGGIVTGLFTPQAVLRSLILFNMLFGVQTAMDIAYLWGGVALPEGMTYAAYAHRGAYPLIATALLAAIFVLVAMPAEEKPRPLILCLVLAFILQNVMLVVSSILRLDLYVETYSLTLLRIAAFIWMCLVAAGLTLILVRILFNRSNGWLVGANLAALAATLYLCAFIDLRGFVANYNVTRHIEHGTSIDRHYLASLGPEALPAIDRLKAHEPDMPDCVRNSIFEMEAGLKSDMEDWRAWTFRDRRLLNYLETRASAKPQPPGEDSPTAEG